MIYVADPTGKTKPKIFCRLCGKLAECNSHMTGKEHMGNVIGPDGNGSEKLHDPSQWIRPMFSDMYSITNARSRAGPFGNQAMQASEAINHQQPGPTAGAQPCVTPPWRATSGAEPAGQPPLESDHQPARERGRSREPKALNTMNNVENHEDENSVKPAHVSNWSEEPCATSESCLFGPSEETAQHVKLEKLEMVKLEEVAKPQEEEWQPPQEEQHVSKLEEVVKPQEVAKPQEEERQPQQEEQHVSKLEEEEQLHAPSAPADAAAGAHNGAEEPPQTRTNAAAAASSVASSGAVTMGQMPKHRHHRLHQHQQGSKRRVPNHGPDPVLKKFCHLMDSFVDALDHASIHIQELHSQCGVDANFSADAFERYQASNNAARLGVAEFRSVMEEMQKTPQTPQIQYAPETPPGPTQTANHSSMRIQHGPTQSAHQRRCGCLAGCGNCFQMKT